jgi:hypothetical protein
MTSASRGGSDRDDSESRQPGYRGSLTLRDDRLGGPWVIAVLAIFVLVFALSFAGLPSRLFPAPSASPIPSEALPSSSLPAQSGSPGASETPAPSASGGAAASGSPAATATPATTATPASSPSPS